jgi:hypothetical protein
MPADTANIMIRIRIRTWNVPSKIALRLLSFAMRFPFIPRELIQIVADHIYVPLWTQAGKGRWRFTMLRVPLKLQPAAVAAAEPSESHEPTNNAAED